MHESVLTWGTSVLTEELIKDKDVLEVGSYNVNGSLREHIESLKPKSYIGSDIEEGPGVDVVHSITEPWPENREKFDVIVTTEMFEHVEDWRRALFEITELLKPNGVLLITTRSEGFFYHPYPDDFWRYTFQDFNYLLGSWLWIDAQNDPEAPGIFILVRKPSVQPTKAKP